MLHAGGVLGFAAFVVWIVVSIPTRGGWDTRPCSWAFPARQSRPI